MESYPLDGMKWDMKEKCIFSLEALDGALTIIVYSKQVGKRIGTERKDGLFKLYSL